MNKENNLLKSQTNFKGNFHVNTNINLLWNKNKKSQEAWLRLGNSKRAKVLRQLMIEETPFQFRFCENMKSSFDLPTKK